MEEEPSCSAAVTLCGYLTKNAPRSSAVLTTRRTCVENKPDMAGQRARTGWLAEAGRSLGQPEADSGAASSLRRASGPESQLVFHRAPHAVRGQEACVADAPVTAVVQRPAAPV